MKSSTSYHGKARASEELGHWEIAAEWRQKAQKAYRIEKANRTTKVTADWLPIGAIASKVLAELSGRLGGKFYYGPKGYVVEFSNKTPRDVIENVIREIGTLNPNLS